MPSSSRQKFLTFGMVILGLAFGAWWYAGFSVEFMKFFAAEPGVVETPTSTPESATTEVDGGVVIRCSPTTQTVNIGSSAEVAVSGAGPFKWLAPGASGTEPALADATNTLKITYDSAGTKQVVVQGPRGEDLTIIDSAVCVVVVTE